MPSGEQPHTRRENLLVLLATGLLAAGLCFAGTRLLETFDYVQFWRPSAQFLTDAIKEGRPPLWNPYVGLGRPHLADMQSAVFYPPLYLVCLGQGLGMFLLVWLHCALGVFGMRALAARLQVGRWQGYLMAGCYLASGELTARWMTGQVHYCWSLCYVPALFACALRTDEPWEARRIGQYALLLALQFLSGHPQVFWFTAIGQAALVVGRAVRWPWRHALLDAGKGLGQLGAAMAWCAGLAAVLLLPFLELVHQGNRSEASPAFANHFKLAGAHLLSLIQTPEKWRLPEGITWETDLFIGPIALLLGLAGLCRVRERNVRGLLAVLLIALLIALGDSTPFFWLFYKWLPGYSGFRDHVREGLLIVLVLVCGAGIWLSRPHPRLSAMWARSFGVPFRPVLIGLVVLQGLNLAYGTWMIKRACDYSALFKVAPDYPIQQGLAGLLRQAGLLAPSKPPPRVCLPWTILPANYGMIYRYSNFDADCSLFLRRPWDYLHAMLGIQPPLFVNNSLSLDIYYHGPFPYPDLALAAGFDPSKGTLYTSTNAAPRAFLVYAAEVVRDYGTVLKRLVQGHAVHQSALLEKPLTMALPRQSPLAGTAANILRFEPNWLLVDVDAKANALLVLAEAWYPGWRAEVDGQPCACVPANLWMRAVPVPAGRHRVRVYFHQDYLLPGLLISLGSAGLLVLVMPQNFRNHFRRYIP